MMNPTQTNGKPGVGQSRPARVAVIGTGLVGSTFAYSLLLSGLASEIVLIDVNLARAEAEALDLNHAMPFCGATRIWAGTYSDCAYADVTVVCAGVGQKPGESRLDLAARNVAVFGEIIPAIRESGFNGTLLIATNPVDVLTFLSIDLLRRSARAVIGSGTVLDTARFRFEISRYFGVDARSVHAHIIGEHGDSAVPVWSNAGIGGVALSQLAAARGFDFDEAAKTEIFRCTRDAAAFIIESKGATYYAIASALTRIVGAILRDEKTVLCVSSLQDDGVCLSLPSIVGRDGIEAVLQPQLDPAETAGLQRSAQILRASLDSIQL